MPMAMHVRNKPRNKDVWRTFKPIRPKEQLLAQVLRCRDSIGDRKNRTHMAVVANGWHRYNITISVAWWPWDHDARQRTPIIQLRRAVSQDLSTSLNQIEIKRNEKIKYLKIARYCFSLMPNDPHWTEYACASGQKSVCCVYNIMHFSFIQWIIQRFKLFDLVSDKLNVLPPMPSPASCASAKNVRCVCVRFCYSGNGLLSCPVVCIFVLTRGCVGRSQWQDMRNERGQKGWPGHLSCIGGEHKFLLHLI